MWNSDGGVGTAYINDSPITSAGLLTSPIINVAGSDTIRITFKHKYDTESCCDHGYVAYSTNGGATWNQFTPTTNTYNNASSTNFGQDPLSSCSATTRASFSGTSPGYIISSGKFAISGVSTLKLAFVFQTDVSLGATGWYIDSVGVDAGNGGCASNRVPDTVFVASVPVEASMMSIPFPVTECSESSELVKIKIRNNGTDTINGNLQATYKILNTLTSVTELVPNIIPPSDSILYTFTTPILTGLSTANIDSTFNLKIFVSLAGDPYPLNDTLTKTVTLNYTPPSPILTNTNAAYASSVVLQALSPDSVSWFSVPVGGTQLVNSHFLTTPVLYDTTVFWAQTSTSGGSHSWTFDNDLAGWTGTNTCTYASNFVWNSDGGVGAAYIVEPGTYSVGLLTSPLIDVTNLDTVKLTFKHRYDTEGCCDKGYVAYSVNGGATWTPFVPTINTYNNPSTTSFPNDPLASCAATTRASYSGASGGYIISSGKIALPLGSASLKLAFAFESDVSVTGAGWFIDSVAVDGGSGGCPSVRVPDTVFVSAPPACEVGVTQIIAPNSSAYLGASEQLKVNIKNFGSSIQTSIPVCYKVGASAVVNDTLNAILNPGDSVTFTFATPVDLSAIQSFNIISYTHASCDLIFSNDTAYRTITHSQYCTSGATSTADEDIGNFTFGNINQGSAVPITSNPSATGLYSNFTTSLPPVYLAKGSTYPISASIVFSGTTSYQGLLNTYIDYNVDGVFDATSEKVFTSVYSPNFTVTGSVTIPLTAASGLSRLRVVADEADLAPPCGTYTFGETEDYSVMIYAPILQDAGVVAFVEPSDSVYNENDSLPVIAKIRNFGTTPITSVQVTATYNALPLGSVVWVGSLAPGAETNVTFNNILCHLAYNNNLCAYTTLAGDSNTFNNNLCKVFRGRPAHDVGAIALVAPTANSCFTANETVIVRIKNFGMKKLYFNQDTVRVYASMAGANPGSFGPTILSSDSLSVGDSMNVVVTTNANMSVGGNYIFNGNTQMTNDGNTANDAFVSSVLTATPTAILPDTVGFTTFTGADLNTGYPHWTEGTGYLYPTGTTSAWLSQSGLGASGNITARINMYTSTRNEWLIGSKFTSTPGTTLEFDAAVTDVNSIALADSMGTDDSVKVMLSTNCGVTWNKIFAITKANHLPNTLTHFSVNLGAYSGQLLRLAFKAQDGPYDDVNDYDFQLDNINIWNKVINIGVNQIVHAVSDTLCVGKEDTVMVRIKNFGNMDASNFPVSYWLTNNSIPTTAVIENFPDTIAPGQEKYFSFGTLFHPTQQVFNLCARTLHTLDMDSTDDKTCRSFIAYINCVGIDEIDFDGFNLGQNIPNPALDNTLINYSIPSNGKVNFQIMSLVGQQIYAEESNAQSGANQITVDTRNMAAGIYYYSVSYKGKRLTKKMIIAK